MKFLFYKRNKRAGLHNIVMSFITLSSFSKKFSRKVFFFISKVAC